MLKGKKELVLPSFGKSNHKDRAPPRNHFAGAGSAVNGDGTKIKRSAKTRTQ